MPGQDDVCAYCGEEDSPELRLTTCNTCQQRVHSNHLAAHKAFDPPNHPRIVGSAEQERLSSIAGSSVQDAVFNAHVPTPSVGSVEQERWTPSKCNCPKCQDVECYYCPDCGYGVRTFESQGISKGSERFHQILKDMGELHDRKQRDYGRPDDPFANVRATEEWGSPAWVGAMIRATDKVKRLQKYAVDRVLANEGARDSFLDLAIYAVIALVLWEEQEG